MEAELAALASSGATTLVGLMVSDAWAQVRDRLVRLLGRGGDAGVFAAELGLSREELAAARESGDEGVAADVEEAWRSLLEEVLRSDPAAVGRLRVLLRQLGSPASEGEADTGGGRGGIRFREEPLPEPGPGRTPDLIPPMTIAFQNRREDLSWLDRRFGAGSGGSSAVRLGSLGGMAGVGKTHLAVEWADRSREQFPGGRLYVDFAALGEGPGGDVAAALGIFLRGLGVADAYVPVSLRERTESYWDRSRERRMLVVLDGVSHAAQVRPLVPKGPGSVVLVASRSALGELSALDGARPLPVEPLDAEGGLLILTDRCDEDVIAADPVAVRRLVELCGGLPVALHVAAARLALSRGRLTPAALVAELEDEEARLSGLSLRGEHSVSAVFALPYGDLPPDAARFYRLLGWLPGRSFDIATAAAAAGIPVAQATASLFALEEASLLDELPDGRFRFTDLVRLHARERALAEEPSSEQRALLLRVTTHYLVLTALADRAIREDRLRIADLDDLLGQVPDPFRAAGGPRPLAWLEAERDNILAVLRAAARAELHTLVWQLAEAYTVLFLHRRHLAMWKESLELGVAAAIAADVPVPAAEARLRSLLSRPLMDLAEYDRAREHLDKAIVRAEESGNKLLEASVQEFSGRYWDRFDPNRATAAYERSLALNIEAQDPRGVAIATYFLGCAQDAQGDHRRALATLRNAHRGLLGVDDQRMAARALAAIGAVHDHLGDTGAALRTLNEAVRTLHEQQAGHYEAQSLVKLADIIGRMGGPREAERGYVGRALAIYEDGGSPEANILRERLEGLAGA